MATAIYPEEIKAMMQAGGHGGNPQTVMMLRLSYVAMGLSGKAGEFTNKVKKLIRDNQGHLDYPQQLEMAKELGGVLWYLATSAKEIGYTLSEIAEMNRVQLANRKVTGTIRGSGDDR